MIVIVLTEVFRGSGVTAVIMTVGAVVSTDQTSLALVVIAFPKASTIPDPAVVSVSAYRPAVAVTPLRFPSVQVMLSVVVNVAAPGSRFSPAPHVRLRSATSNPLTGSENTIATVLTALFRGSGATSMMSAVGAVRVHCPRVAGVARE